MRNGPQNIPAQLIQPDQIYNKWKETHQTRWNEVIKYPSTFRYLFGLCHQFRVEHKAKFNLLVLS